MQQTQNNCILGLFYFRQALNKTFMNSIRNLMVIISMFLLGLPLSAQQWFVGIETAWTDSFVEWRLYTESEFDDEDEALEASGELELRWKNQDNWTEWDFQVGDERGQIAQVSRNRPDQWEVRGDGVLVTMRPRWNNDLTEWKITDGNTSFVFKSKWRNNLDEWILDNDHYGHFSLQTAWERDPRQWNIYDELNEEIPLNLKMAMVFIATYYSSPKI